MKNYTVLYNPIAGSGRGETETKKLPEIMKNHDLKFVDMTAINDYNVFFDSLDEDEVIIISGGDGTLNRFINETEGIDYLNDIYYFATGSGNDFLHDVGKKAGDAPFCINSYISDLPKVTVNGKTYRFLNGVGYGIDGYCCQVGDSLRDNSGKPVNYTSIAIKGLLFDYKPTNAKITVDGKEYTYKKVWLAPTMNGRFYGGGMMPAPNQDRLSSSGKVSLMVMWGAGKMKTLAVFPSIFKGKHIEHTDMVEILTGNNIEVEFDRPTALQIDGETIEGVTGYSVCACERVREEVPA